VLFVVNSPCKLISSNTKDPRSLVLPSFIKFAIVSNQEFILDYIDIFIESTDTDPEDAIEIRLIVKDGCSLKYLVPYSEIARDFTLRLLMEESVIVKDLIEIYVVTHNTKGSVNICVNNAGPCFSVFGHTTRRIELNHTPLISIITPVYKTSIKYLSDMVTSVTNQIYTNWELCIVNDGSDDKDLTEYLQSIKSPKIKIKSLKTNLGIAAATNAALNLAAGEYACLLDHDDTLSPVALLEIASVFNKDPEAELIYSDEDKLTEEGLYVEPFFKPDWSYSLLLSQNYICHLSTFRTDTLRKLGGMRVGFEGSQDYDLLLRVVESVLASKIHHIPKILYHWRKHAESTASNIEVKPGAHLSALKALKEHLIRIGSIRSTVTVGAYLGTYRVSHRDYKKSPVNIVIPTRDNPEYLEACLFSVLESTYKKLSITIVDNGSNNPETLQLLKNIERYPQCQVLRYDQPFNYSAINNYAVKNGAKADRYIFLNDDTEVISPDWIEQLLQQIGRDRVRVAGAKLLYGNNKLQHAGVIIGIGGVSGHSHKHVPNSHPGYFSRPHLIQNVSAVTGACMMVDAETFEQVEGFEERLPRAFNDIDFCLKVRAAGYKIVYNPYACLYHHESISRGLDNHKEKLFAEAIEYMQNKWDCKNFKDPYYNPNLTLVSENFSYRID